MLAMPLSLILGGIRWWVGWWRCMLGGAFIGMNKSVRGRERYWWLTGSSEVSGVEIYHVSEADSLDIFPTVNGFKFVTSHEHCIICIHINFCININGQTISRPLHLLFSFLRLPILYRPSKPAYSLSRPIVDAHRFLAVNYQRTLGIEAIHVSRDMYVSRMAIS